MELPPWCDGLRPGQENAIAAISDAFAAGHRFVVLDGPTGSGKSLVGEMSRQMLDTRGIYLCTTKSLQQQFATDFTEGALIKGRSNYPTADYPEMFDDPVSPITAGDCTKERVELPACGSCPPVENDEDNEGLHCHFCHGVESCEYEMAKARALYADLMIANVSYFLTEANGPGRVCGGNREGGHSPDPHGRGLVIIDEADLGEQELLSFAEVHISARRQQRWGLKPPKVTVADDWPEWVANYAIPKLERVRSLLPRGMDIKAMRERKALTQLIGDLRAIDFSTDNWLYVGSDVTGIRFKPVRVDQMAQKLLWRHGRRFLLMSATVVSAQEMATTLGIDSFAYVEMPSSFAPERRPVIVRPVADMSRKVAETSENGNYEEMGQEIARILDDYPNERVLVHTVSFALTEYLQGVLDSDRVLTYKAAAQRDEVLARYRATPGAVLLAPSLDRGIDLKDDDCRVVIVAKVPWLDLSDKQTAARLYSPGGGHWYATATIRTLVQMLGRGMRHEDDYMDGYILDKQFTGNLYKRYGYLFPRWFSEALDLSGGIVTQRRRDAASRARANGNGNGITNGNGSGNGKDTGNGSSV